MQGGREGLARPGCQEHGSWRARGRRGEVTPGGLRCHLQAPLFVPVLQFVNHYGPPSFAPSPHPLRWLPDGLPQARTLSSEGSGGDTGMPLRLHPWLITRLSERVTCSRILYSVPRTPISCSLKGGGRKKEAHPGSWMGGPCLLLPWLPPAHSRWEPEHVSPCGCPAPGEALF